MATWIDKQKLKWTAISVLIGGATFAIKFLYDINAEHRAQQAAYRDTVREIRIITETLQESYYRQRIPRQLENFERALDAWKEPGAVPADIAVIPQQITENSRDVMVEYAKLDDLIGGLTLGGDRERLSELAGLMGRVRVNSEGLFRHALRRFSESALSLGEGRAFEAEKARLSGIAAEIRALLAGETDALFTCVVRLLAEVEADGGRGEGAVCPEERQRYLARHAEILKL